MTVLLLAKKSMKKIFLALFLSLASVSLVVHETRATMPADDGTDSYTGNSSTTVFAYNFMLLDQTHIKVLVDGVLKTLATHYTVSGVGNSAGGTVTFVTAPAANARVVLVRGSPYSQPTNYVANSAYSATTVMRSLDRLTALTQQLEEKIARAYKVIEGYAQAALPNVCSGTQKMIGFDATGAINCAADLNAAAATANQWDQITAPTGNAAFSHGNNRTTVTYGSATGASAPFRLTDTAANSGTGALLQLDTAAGSALKPFQATVEGTTNGVQMSSAGALAPIGSGTIVASSLTGTLAVANGGTGQTSATAAFNALDPLTTKGDLVIHDGTNSVRSAVCANERALVGDSTQTVGWRCNTTAPIQTLVVKTADETVNNSAAFQSDDHLLFACAANTSYDFKIKMMYSSVSATPGIKFQFTVPAAATIFWHTLPYYDGAAYQHTWSGGPATTKTALLGSGNTHATLTIAGTTGYMIEGIARCAGTAGNIQFQWAQNSATAEDTKVLKDSHIMVTRLNQ